MISESVVNSLIFNHAVISSKIMTVSIVQPFYFTHACSAQNYITVPFYGNLSQADNYFTQRLRADSWTNASKDDKVKALIEATRIIDSLSFISRKVNDQQPLQFPRGFQTKIPIQIEIACYEIAVELLDGFDPNIEQSNLSVQSQGFGGTRTTYDRSFVQEHLRAGIPSALAWTYLKQYLSDPSYVHISRVN